MVEWHGRGRGPLHMMELVWLRRWTTAHGGAGMAVEVDLCPWRSWHGLGDGTLQYLVPGLRVSDIYATYYGMNF